MANKQSIGKKTGTEKTATGAGSARVAKQAATPRVKTVKHSKATVAEVPVPETAVITPATTQIEATLGKQTEDPREAIAKIAYGYWAARGYQGGSPAEDWFRAEAEYLGR